MTTDIKIVNKEPDDVATLKREEVRRAYVLLGLDPDAWDYTTSISIFPLSVLVERHTTRPPTLGPDDEVETMISTINIEG
jgi:hypothetical protein